MTSIKMGRLPKSFNDAQYQNITFCVTEECNLRCKYCYMAHKNSFHKMSYETAKAAVDFFLDQPVTLDAVVWDFIGGEPTLEMELIDKVSDYIKYQMYVRKHPWFDNYMFSIGSNGLLYDSPEVQNYITKNKSHISFGITIDGTKEKHDMQRVRFDGSGSYDKVYENVKLWLSQYPEGITKVTFSSSDLVYLKDSIIHLWNTGLKMIPANIVFEDVWKDGDVEIFEDQLRQLADYVLENKLFWDYSVRFFDPTVGYPVGQAQKKANYCGSGRMVAVDCDGKLYPCIRFLEFCLSDPNTPSLSSGSIEQGFNKNVLEAFEMLNIETMSDAECNSCPIASGCFACAGNNYNCSESHTIFKKSKYHCELQKAQVRVNHYFWDRVIEITKKPSPFEIEKKKAFVTSGFHMDGAKYIYFILNDQIVPHCMYHSSGDTNHAMTKEIFKLGVSFAYENEYVPVYLGDPEPYLDEFYKNKFHIRIDSGVFSPPSGINEGESSAAYYVPVFSSADYRTASNKLAVAILLIQSKDLPLMTEIIQYLSRYCKRINIIKQDLAQWNQNDFDMYGEQIIAVKELVERGIVTSSINVIQNSSVARQRNNCAAGISEFSYAPDGKFYICPAAYFGHQENVGDLTGINVPDQDLRKIEKSPKCATCNVLHCLRCPVQNKMTSSMINVPSTKQCVVGKIEVSKKKNKNWR